MKADDLEELEASRALASLDGYQTALPVYRFEVTLSDGRVYLANEVKVEVLQAGDAAYFQVELRDCWAWVKHRQVRTLRRVLVHTFDNVIIEDWAQS
jgi:hypothetical protein